MYHLLVSTTKGVALSLVRLTDRGSGFEAMRKISKEYMPRLNEEHGAMLQQILKPTWWREREHSQRFPEVLVAWDEVIARRQVRSLRVTCARATSCRTALRTSG